VREWTLTLPRELPLWELESRWTAESSKSDCKGQNSMDWGVPHIIGKLLELRCLKWAHMTHLDIWDTSYGQKKSRESNWQFDYRPLKVGNHLDFLMCRWCVTYCWRVLQLCFRLHFHRRSTRKVAGVPAMRISRLPLGSLETKCHLDLGLVEKHKIYYKGEGDGFPQF